MKHLILPLFLLLLGNVFGQQISATFMSSYNRQVLKGLRVELTDKKNEVVGSRTTDAFGRVFFDSLPMGDYNLNVYDTTWICIPVFVSLDRRHKSFEGQVTMEFSGQKRLRDYGDFMGTKEELEKLCKEANQSDSLPKVIFSDEDKKKLIQYITENIRYPEIAVELGMQGKVYLLILANAKNDIVKIAILKGVEPELNYEAVRLFKDMKRISLSNPIEKGMYVITFPVTFKLE